MNIVIVHGQNHKGSTYHIAHALAKKLGGTIPEFFLPRDFGSFCVGCVQCFLKSETKCPHFAKLQPITEAIDKADVIILASPVYVYHATGAMKAWLDHYGYQWMVHRPKEIMFEKQAVCIATAAGAGTKTATADMADSLFFWGVGKIYRYGVNIFSTAPITFAQAALGGDIRISTVDGDVVYTVKAGTQTGTRIRLKGKGVPSLHNRNVRGDQYVTLVIQTPTNLSKEAKEALKQFDEACGGHTDTNGGGKKKKKFWE